MKKRPSTRTAHAYVLQAHKATGSKYEGIEDYVHFFDRIIERPEDEFKRQEKGVLYAFEIKKEEGDRYEIIIREGDVGVHPLLYDEINSTERIGPKKVQETLVTRTHAVVDAVSRRLVVEFNQRGAKASVLESLLHNFGRNIYGESFSLILAPIPGSEFKQALDELDRIKSAKVIITEPNFTWDVDEVLEKPMEESDAKMATLEFRSHPKSSLHKNRGLIGYLKELHKKPTPAEKEAVVEGKTANGRNKTVRLVKNIEKRSIGVTFSEKDGAPRSDVVLSNLHAYLNDLVDSPLPKGDES